MKPSTDWRSELRRCGEPAAAALALARILGARARGAAIFLLDLSAENLILSGLWPAREAAAELAAPFGRPDDPLTFCLLEGVRVDMDNREAGPEEPSLALLNGIYENSFSRLTAWPLRGGRDRLLGAAVILDAAGEDSAEYVVDFGALVIEGLLEARRHRRETGQVMEELKRAEAAAERERGGRAHELIGQSAPMRQVRRLIEKAARHRGTVLLTGETGTGKELASAAIHGLGPGGPFVKIDCAAIPRHLLESELFGCKKGAFTGADQDREGLIAAADGGVLLLDEIGELSLEMQAKLLRLLQERRVRPVGGVRERPVDVSFIAATNRDLKAAMAAGSFRPDLYHRLAVFPIHLPPLRERREDIPLLAAHFLAEFGRRCGRPPGLAISSQALRRLYGLDYGGNVRELAARVERAVMLSGPEEAVLGLEYFTQEREEAARSLPEKMAAYEKKLIEEALAAAGGNQNDAAEALGIPRRTLSHKARGFSKQAEEYICGG